MRKKADWFTRNYGNQTKEVRFMANVPIYVTVKDSGNPEADQTNAYNTIREILDAGSGRVSHQGFNDQLVLSNVQPV